MLRKAINNILRKIVHQVGSIFKYYGVLNTVKVNFNLTKVNAEMHKFSKNLGVTVKFELL
jgi:hypothetical protein